VPSVSKKQHNLMEAVAHNPGFAKKVGIPQKVGKHFHEADKMKRKKFDEGGQASSKADKEWWRHGNPSAPKTTKDIPSDDYADAYGFDSASQAGSYLYDKTKKALGPGIGDALGFTVGTVGALPARGISMLYRKVTGHTPPPRSDNEEYRKGGKVKHANELHGKAKETKSIAKEEMKALKRGHAPKEILEHEKAEHKAMGYKKGGKIETPKKGFAMAETKGGRKPPHSKKGEEGDTKLKGFGMGKGLGKGRKVTKAATPKDEMPRKGFAMKKGGHVKKHEKHMARGGMGAPARKPHVPKPPKADPAAIAALMGPAMGGGAPAPGAGMPPMGGPTMGAKKGGHISHHHHHHYAKGGHVKGEHKHEDGIAEKGHTRGKQVKMASGGHVGSHPSRRADGAAHKGHTRCKVV